MDELDLPKSVRSVTILQGDKPTVIYKEKTKKKGLKVLRPIHNALKTMADAQKATLETLVDEMDRSDLKKKDGWLRDLPRNLRKSTKRGLKVVIKKYF